MNYGEIKTNDVANGEGVRLSLFVSGCRNHCPGCFNKETWDFNFGKEFTDDVESQILKELYKPQYQGISILGGEPLEPENLERVAQLCYMVKTTMPNKDIWLYTGYTLEDIYLEEEYKWNKHNNTLEELAYSIDFGTLLMKVDVIVDGKFIEELKDLTLKFRGSSNQRIIDMNRTREEKKIVLWDK